MHRCLAYVKLRCISQDFYSVRIDFAGASLHEGQQVSISVWVSYFPIQTLTKLFLFIFNSLLVSPLIKTKGLKI